MTKVKICGLMCPEDADIINRVRPDYAGMILAEGFRRTVSFDTARSIRKRLDPSIPLVGVFVDADVQTILRFSDTGIIDIIQLHGSESSDTVLSIKERCKIPVWKACRITEDSDFDEIEKCPADLLLLDSGQGSGQTFDWSIACRISRPFLLAGGLEPANVRRAIDEVHPFGVDVSSGVETDGKKDEKKISDFVHVVRERKGDIRWSL